jgi:hypothetical protein
MFPIALARQVFANPGWCFGSPDEGPWPSLSVGADIQRFDAPKMNHHRWMSSSDKLGLIFPSTRQ